MTYTIIKWRDAVHASHQLTFAERLCLLQMQTYADAKTGRCIPGNRTIARKVGCNVSIVKRAWVKAVDARLMTRDLRYQGDRQTTCVTYLTVPTERLSGGTTVAGEGGLRSPGEGGLRSPPRTSQEGISQFNKEIPTTLETESPMPSPNPSGGAEPHEENELDNMTPCENPKCRDGDCIDCENTGWVDPAHAHQQRKQYAMDDEPECSATDITTEPLENIEQLPELYPTADSLNKWHHVPNAGQMVNASAQMRADLARPIPAPVHYVPESVTIKSFPDHIVRHNIVDLDNHRQAWNQIIKRKWNERHTGWILQWLPIMDAAQYRAWMDVCSEKDGDYPVKWLHSVMIRIMNGKQYRHAGNDRNSGRSTDRNSGRGQG